MIKIIVSVDGMMCGMCENHVNDSVRRAFPVKKVTSSHSKGQTVIVTEKDIEDSIIEDVINKTGYTMTGIRREPFEKKGLFSFMKGKD